MLLFSAFGWIGGASGRGCLIVQLSCRQSWHSFLQNNDDDDDDEIRFEL